MKKLTSNFCKTALVLALSPAVALAAGHGDIDSLKKRIAKLEKSAVTKTKGGIKIGNTTLAVGGYIKADATSFNNGVNGTLTNLVLTRQTAGAGVQGGQRRIDLSARESRFRIKTSTPYGGKALKTNIEVDFFGTSGNEAVSNSHAPRLRHAYATWGNVLMGQTWSTFMDLNHLGELSSFGQHASTIFVRQTQFRYTIPFSGGSVMLAIENPESFTGAAIPDNQKNPDLIARINFKGSFGHVSAGLVSRKLTEVGSANTVNGTAYSLTGRFPTFGKDDIKLQYNKGALGRYMGLTAYPDTNPNTAALDTLEVKGFSAAYRHFWNSKIRSTVMYSKTEADDVVAAAAIKEAESLHVNLMWNANPKLRYAIEYATWEVEKQGQAINNELDVVQLSARILF